MAKKPILGIDIGHDSLKLALVKGNDVLNVVSVPTPPETFEGGYIRSPDELGDLISDTLKKNKMSAKEAAFILPREASYVKTISVPLMNTEQLMSNLPYEFSDYISGDTKDYIFDYAVLPNEEEETEEDAKYIKALAAGTPIKVLQDFSTVAHKAGLKVVKTAPQLYAFISLIRENHGVVEKANNEVGILDIGYESIRLYMYEKDRHIATRVLDTGLSDFDYTLADISGIDVQQAHNCILHNTENCLELEGLKKRYEDIAVDLMRAVNFYNFSNPDNQLAALWYCGGGTKNQPLLDAIRDTIDISLYPASEFITNGENIPSCNTFVQAIGVTYK